MSVEIPEKRQSILQLSISRRLSKWEEGAKDDSALTRYLIWETGVPDCLQLERTHGASNLANVNRHVRQQCFIGIGREGRNGGQNPVAPGAHRQRRCRDPCRFKRPSGSHERLNLLSSGCPQAPPTPTSRSSPQSLSPSSKLLGMTARR